MLTRPQFVAKYSANFGCKSAFLVAGEALLQPGNKAGTVQHASPLWLASHHKVSSTCIWVPGCPQDCQMHHHKVTIGNCIVFKVLTTSQLAASPRCPAAKRKEFVAVRPTTFFIKLDSETRCPGCSLEQQADSGSTPSWWQAWRSSSRAAGNTQEPYGGVADHRLGHQLDL